MPSVYLHIGAAKTGTTYLQDLLFAGRSTLAEAGVLVPGGYAQAHFDAALDLRGMAFGGHADPGVRGRWQRLVAESLDFSGPSVVISHEIFGGSLEPVVDAVADAFAGADLHVVLTARDLGRQVPAMWQEQVKNAGTVDFARYVHRLTQEPRRGRPVRTFWRQQHLAEVAERWCARVPAERFHVVTVAPQGSDPALLWHRFAAVVGVDPDIVGAARPSANQSLPYAGAELLRRVNSSLGDDLAWPAYAATVKGWFVESLLDVHGSGPRAAVPVEHRDWFTERQADIVRRLRALKVQVIGDLDELTPAFGDALPGPDPAAVLDAASDVLAVMLRERAARRWSGGDALAVRARRSRVAHRLPADVQRWLKRRANL
jgi:hypothetical protein